MAAVIGVSSTFQAYVTAPSGCVINEVTKDASQEVKTIKNASGVTVQAGILPMVTTKYTVKGKGYPALSTVVAGTAGVGASVTSGTISPQSISVDESNEDYPDWTIEAIAFS